MNLFRQRLVRLPVLAIGLLAWLAVSNHCALGAAEDAAKIPMPSCHGVVPAEHSPSKHDQQGGIECCKVLRATLLEPASSLVAADALSFVAQDYIVTLISAAEEARLLRVIEWDTGPPLADSFAETVLQRSILAHAPPFLS